MRVMTTRRSLFRRRITTKKVARKMRANSSGMLMLVRALTRIATFCSLNEKVHL